MKMVNLFRGGVDLRMKEIRVEKGIHIVLISSVVC